MQDHREVSHIIIGKRHRQDLGDIAGLAASINEFGLLHPVVIGPSGKLIAGERRLRAVMLLGWATVAVHVISVDDILNCEVCENEERKAFTFSEAVSIARELKPAIAAAALARKKGGIRTKGHGKTGDIVAPFTSKGRESLKRAEELVKAAEADPAKYGRLVELMDRSDSVMGPWRQLKAMQRATPTPTPEQIKVAARSERWRLLRDGMSFLDQLPPVAGSDLLGLLRQHDPGRRYVTTERIERLQAWLNDLSKLIDTDGNAWQAPTKKRRLERMAAAG